MLDMSPRRYDLASAYNHHFSTINSALWADYVTDVLGPKGLPILFQNILPGDLSNSATLNVNGEPVGYPFFVQPDNWFSNDIGMQFYENLKAVNPDMVEVGSAMAHIALKKRNILELRMLTLPKAALILRNMARISSRMATNKTPRIVSLTRNSGHLALTYHEGMTHTAAATDYFRGFIIGCLEFLGFKAVQSSVLFDHLDEPTRGETELHFTWQEKSFPDRFKIHALEMHLSRREQEIVRFLSEGFTIKEICYLTDITYETVKFHLVNARKKLDCRTREELVAKFVAMHLK